MGKDIHTAAELPVQNNENFIWHVSQVPSENTPVLYAPEPTGQEVISIIS